VFNRATADQDFKIAKVGVEGSNPFARSSFTNILKAIAGRRASRGDHGFSGCRCFNDGNKVDAQVGQGLLAV
jgi:hypothetical protein